MLKSKKALLFVGVVIFTIVGLFVWRSWKLGELSESKWPELDGGVYAEPVSDNGLSYLIPPNEVFDAGIGENGHPALTEPKYDNVLTADEKLADEVLGIALDVNGQHYFYSFQIMNWHEVVQDVFGDEELVVTYSALTGSAVVYKAEGKDFVVSGKVYNNATLLKEVGTDNLWNQSTGQLVVGDDVGKSLEVYPSSVMSWAEWKSRYPNGLALSMDTGHVFDYAHHPYGKYDTSPGIFFPVNHLFTRVDLKDVVYPITHNGDTVVYNHAYVGKQQDINEMVGADGDMRYVVAFKDADADVVSVFNREIEAGRVLTFERSGNSYKDKETGSTWNAEGLATRGELSGTQLEKIPTTRHFAFAYFALFPQSRISGEELLKPENAVDGQILEIK